MPAFAPPAQQGAPHIDLPWCFHSNDGPSQYAVDGGITTRPDGLSARLRLKTRAQKELGPDVERLSLEVENLGPAALRLRLTDAGASRWELPASLLRSDLATLAGTSSGAGGDSKGPKRLYRSEYQADPFSFRVLRSGGASDGIPVFDTTGLRLVFKVRGQGR